MLKDTHVKIFSVDRFFKFLLQSDNELLVSEEIGGHRLCFSVWKTTLILKNCHIIQHGLQGIIVKNMSRWRQKLQTSINSLVAHKA